jgi:glycosyltransferase involved in cell wall biosynthesis
MDEKTIILIPVYNDTLSVNLLLKNIVSALGSESGYLILIVDDGSTDNLDIQQTGAAKIKVLTLKRNIGHQKALAVGLAYIKDKIPCKRVLIMDGDGQDDPVDALQLLNNEFNNNGKIVFASRKSRQEGVSFKFFYKLYKILFVLLTGRQISFGNFLVIPRQALDKIVFYSEIWNHLPGGIIKSGLPYTSLEINRAKRYFDKSKMNFNSLVLHGLGAVSVFLDTIAIRLLIFSFIMIILSLIIIISIIAIKSFTNLAIPGWASTVVSSFVIILLQSFLLSLFTAFLYLTSQSQRKFIPGNHYMDYVDDTKSVS